MFSTVMSLANYCCGRGCSTEIPSLCATWNFIAMFVQLHRWNTVSSASLTPFTHSQCVLVRCNLMLFSIYAYVFQLVSSLEIFWCFIWHLSLCNMPHRIYPSLNYTHIRYCSQYSDYAKGWTIWDSIPGRDKRPFFARMSILSPVHTHTYLFNGYWGFFPWG